MARCSATEGWKTRFSTIILEDVTMENLETLKAMRRNKLTITGEDVSIGFFLVLSVSLSLTPSLSLSLSLSPPPLRLSTSLERRWVSECRGKNASDNETFESIQMQQRSPHKLRSR